MMKRNISALATGTLFGIGLTISQMLNPEKVIGFLDLFGQWDPSLAFVMAGALMVTALGYRLVHKQSKPLFNERFDLPSNRHIDSRLAAGSALFGIGWGLVGLCPGPAIAALFIGGLPIVVFLVSMAVGAYLFELLNQNANHLQSAL